MLRFKGHFDTEINVYPVKLQSLMNFAFIIFTIFQVNKMALDTKSDDNDPFKFVIHSNDPSRDQLRIVCQAEDEESRARWTGIIEKQLKIQKDFLMALQAPTIFWGAGNKKDP